MAGESGAIVTQSPVQTLPALLVARADADPDATAILSSEGERLSAGALAGRLADVGGTLAAHGLGRSDRVAVVAGLGPRAAVAVLGVAAHATCVPVDPAADAELSAVLRQTGSKALLAPYGASAGQRAATERLGLMLLDGLPEGPPASGNGTEPNSETAAPDDVAFVLRTSGTTGAPKLVPATHRQVAARVLEAREALGLGPSDRCLSPMPLCYTHGLYSGLLFSLLAGGSVVLPERFDEDSFLDALASLAPTWYTAGSTQHQAILGWLRRRGGEQWGGGLRFARCANASLPAGAREDLERILGAPVIGSYGTSETGAITSERPGGRRKPGALGTSTGAELAILDDAGTPLPPGTSGAIAVRGPAVFSGYEGDSELNRRAFRDGWFMTGDGGSLDADGFLTFEGRLDDLVNRGGENVAPAEVEAVLLEHPAVAEAVVFGVPHRTLGEDLAAAVQPAAGAEPSKGELRSYLTARLSKSKVPRRIVLVPALALGPTGKPVRAGIADRVGLAPEGSNAGDSTELGLLERRLCVLWGEALEGPDAGPDQDFFDLGGDSLAAVALLAAIDEELNVGLELEDLIEAPTPYRLAGRINKIVGRARDPRHGGRSVVGVNTSGDLRPLFAIPGRPGYALRVLLVGRELGASQPVYGLQPPGMDWHAAGVSTVPAMAAHYLERVKEIQPSGPYRLLGSSFGGLIAFEMALQLERGGESVEFVGLIDTGPPAFSGSRSTRSLFPLGLGRRARERKASNPIVAAGTRTATVHAGARASYAISDRLGSDITLFVCTADGFPAEGERRHQWADATSGGLRLIELPGYHAQFDHEPQFSALRDALRACLSDGEPPRGADPAAIFGRSYALEQQAEGEAVVDSAGSVHRVEQGAIGGRVSPILRRRGKLLLRGWAGEPDRGPGGIVVAFLDGRFAGYSKCGAPTEGLARRLESPALRHAGYRIWLEAPDDDAATPRPRVFALTGDGRASELEVR